jgi:hypothetical protein
MKGAERDWVERRPEPRADGRSVGIGGNRGSVILRGFNSPMSSRDDEKDLRLVVGYGREV